MIRRLWILGCILALGACDGGDDPVDAGDRDDAGGSVDGGPPPSQPLVMAIGDDLTPVPADLTCLGTRMAPPAGAEMDYLVRTVSRGLADEARPETTFQIYPDNQIPLDETCTAPCVELTTSDPAGTAMIMDLPSTGYFAWRILADGAGADAIATSASINVVPDPGSSIEGEPDALELTVISNATFNLALVAGNVDAQAGASIFLGTAVDCMGRPLMNGVLRVFDDEGEIVGGTVNSGVRIIYWADQPAGGEPPVFPVGNRAYTSNQGRYAAANLPAGGTLRAELWATTVEGEAPHAIGCEEFSGIEGITVLNLAPLRADGPSSCPDP
jgi:hypothetical protein